MKLASSKSWSTPAACARCFSDRETNTAPVAQSLQSRLKHMSAKICYFPFNWWLLTSAVQRPVEEGCGPTVPAEGRLDRKMRTLGECFSHPYMDITMNLIKTARDAVAQPGRWTRRAIITNVLKDEDKPRFFKRPDSSSARDLLSANITPQSHPVYVRTWCKMSRSY